MYTTQKIAALEQHLPEGWELWEILDSEGIQICTVLSEESADALLSHLNR